MLQLLSLDLVNNISSYGGTLALLNSSRILSTSWNTLKKFKPANFFKSSTLHLPVPINAANKFGYDDTSSKPVGTLN